jgi:uncharacterized protein YuzE
MELTYDPKYNIAYIRFRPKKAEVESIKISDELIVDIGNDGTIYGIELLNANEQIQREEEADLVVFNKGTGKKLSVPLPM